MDIRDLLEQRKMELYGEYDSVYESMGDITGEDDGYYDDDDDEYGGLGFTEQDILDIELEASLIDDPDEYIDEVTEDFSNIAIGLAGEIYMDNLIVEEALFDCTTIEELEVVEEGVKEAIKEKADKAINKIKELWKKFKAWIINLKNVVVNMFTSGAKLVEKNRSTIAQNAAARGKKIKVKCYDYHLDQNEAAKVANSILNLTKEQINAAGSGKKVDMSGASKAVRQGLGDNGGAMDKEFVKKRAARCVRGEGDKKERTIADLNIQDVMDVCANKKGAIKAIKDVEKAADQGFKDAISAIKAYEPKSDEAKDKRDNKDVISTQVKFVKKMQAMMSSFVKAFISELKAANRACAAICRKLLNQSTGGGETETKLHKKWRER